MPTTPAMVVTDLDFGTVQVHIAGHVLYMPYKTLASTGIAEACVAPGAPRIMRAGTPSVHIMIAHIAQQRRG